MKKITKITFWIIILLFFGISGIFFYIFHSNIWKTATLTMLQDQLTARSELILDVGELSGSPFWNLKFNSIRLSTPLGNDVIDISEIVLNYGLLHFFLKKGEIQSLTIQGVRFSYPDVVDSLSVYFYKSTGSGIKSSLSLNHFEILDVQISDSHEPSRAMLFCNNIQGKVLLTPDSLNFILGNSALNFNTINEQVNIQNARLTMINDSLIVRQGVIKNKSTTLNLQGWASLNSDLRIKMYCDIKNLILQERFLGNNLPFFADDYLNLKCQINYSGEEVNLRSSFNGQIIDNKLSKGIISGVIRNNEFQVDKMSVQSGNQLLSGTISGNLSDGLNASINVENVDLETWNLTGFRTSGTGNIQLETHGELISPDSVFADFALHDFLIDTLNIDTARGELLLSNGILTIIDTVDVEFAQTDIKVEGYCNLNTDSVDARIYFSSDSIGVFSNLLRLKNVQGNLDGFLEASGRLTTPDFRGWLNGFDIGVSIFYFENAIARFGFLNIKEKHFGDIYIEATNGVTPLIKEKIPLASLIIRFEKDTSIVRSLRVVSDEMNIEVQGKVVKYTDLYFDRIHIFRNGNYLDNIDPIHISLKADTISLAEVRFTVNDGLVVVSGESVNNRIQSAVVNIRDFDINPLNDYLKGSKGIAGVMDGLISYSDIAGSPMIYSRFNLKKASLIGKSFKNVRLESRLVPDTLIFENIFLEDNENGYMNGFGHIDCHYPFESGVSFLQPEDSIDIQMQFDSFDFNIFSSFVFERLYKTGKLSGGFAIGNSLEFPEFNFDLAITDPVFDRLTGDRLTSKGAYSDQKLQFSDIQLYDQYGVTKGSGYLPYTFSFNPGLASFNRDSQMQMNLTMHSTAVEFLTKYLDIIENIEGEYDLALSLSGTPNEPVRSGNIIAKNGLIRVSALENPITGLTGSAILRDNIMEIVSMEGYMIKPISQRKIESIKQKIRQYTMDILFPPSKVPDEPNVKVHGKIDFSTFFEPVFNITMDGNNMYVRTLLAEQEGILNGSFSVIGGDTLSIEGDVDINEFIIRNEFGGSESLIEEDEKEGRVFTMINLHTLIPGNLYFRNSQLDCELEGEMWIVRNGNDPYQFSGTLDIRKGKFFYYGWEFDVEQGSITFDPTEFNPTLNIEAKVDLASYSDYSTTEETADQEDYVTVRLSGDMTNPSLEFSSEKYNEGDILMFLTRTQLGTEDALNQSRISADAMNVFGAYFERQLEKSIGQIAGLDEFELRTKGNLLSNQQTDQWSVSLGQKLAPNLYFKYERSLSLIEPTQLFGIEYRLNRNFSVTGEVEQDGSFRINYLYKYRY